MMAEGAKGIGTSAGYEQTRTIEAPITLAEAGIDKNLADRARKFAAIPEQEFNSTISDWRARVEEENERVTGGLRENPPAYAPITLAEAGIDKNYGLKPQIVITNARFDIINVACARETKPKVIVV